MSYNTVTVEIDYDEADKIVVANLNSMLECLEDDYELRKEGRGMAIFEKTKMKTLRYLRSISSLLKRC
jgi:hypothetical protein